MFKHIGKKLKVFAEIWCLLGILGAIAAGVLLYLVKKPPMELQYCITIAVGGVIVAILSSWGIYALGDIHAKLERLEDKLIPKPNYMSYLEENQALRGKCEICGKDIKFGRICAACAKNVVSRNGESAVKIEDIGEEPIPLSMRGTSGRMFTR